MITFPQFVQQNPAGKTVASPEGTWAGQCVSLVRQMLLQIYGFNQGPMGDAVDFASAANQAKLATIGLTWKTDTNFQDGDILVWGDDIGAWTGPNGHIGSWYQGQMYNQNYGNTLKISFNKFFPQGYLGRYTKGSDMVQNTDDEYNWVNALLLATEGKGLDRDYFNAHVVGRSYLSVIKDSLSSPNAATVQDYVKWGKMAKDDDWQGQINDLKASANFIPVTETLYRKA